MFKKSKLIRGDTITYLLIFSLKIIENALATLRIIVIANGKKFIGAFLNFLMSLVLVNIQTDPIKIIAYSFGTFFGSYMGSLIEERLALGNNMIIAITDKEKNTVIDKLREQHYPVISLEGKELEEEKDILLITTTRKKKRNVIHLIKRIDKKCSIIIDNAYLDTKI